MLVIIKFFRYQKCYNTRWPVYKFVFQLLWCPYSSTRCLLSLLLIRCNTFLKELFFINTDIVAAHASIVSSLYPSNCWRISYIFIYSISYSAFPMVNTRILNQIKLIINISQNCHHFHVVIASTISLFGHSTASV